MKDLFVLRIEVYPETADDKYFAIKLRKKKKILREEACEFDEQGRLKIVWGADAYGIFLRSCYKTHITRSLENEGEEKKGPTQAVEDPFFDSDTEGYEN